jgi:hypothetical protein
MRAENWQSQTFELDGWSVQLTSYSISGRYVAEVETTSSGVTISRAAEASRDNAENRALEKALVRLQSTRRINLDLTVGG